MKKKEINSSFAFICVFGACRKLTPLFCQSQKWFGSTDCTQTTRSAHTIDITSLGHYALDTSKEAELPQITRPQSGQSALSPTITGGIPQKNESGGSRTPGSATTS